MLDRLRHIERMFRFSPEKSIYANKSSKYLRTKNKSERERTKLFNFSKQKTFRSKKIIQWIKDRERRLQAVKRFFEVVVI